MLTVSLDGFGIPFSRAMAASVETDTDADADVVALLVDPNALPLSELYNSRP